MIILNNLTKTYKKNKHDKDKTKEKILAIDHLDIEIKKGEIYGLIGPNGAGKTTALKILSTLILPDEGNATIDGYDVVKNPEVVKGKIGLLSGEFARSLYWRLTGKQNIEFFAKLKNIKDFQNKSDELLELFNLKKWENELIMKYSTGMKHKLALAVGLLNDPEILFLDEPLTGMDPISARDIKNLIKNEFKGKTIIFASHNLYEIEQMCDRIGLINKGKLMVEGKPDDLKKDYWGYDKILIITNNTKPFSILKNVDIRDNIVEVKTNDVKKTYLEIMKVVKESNVDIKEIKTMRPSLEDVFFKGVQHVS